MGLLFLCVKLAVIYKVQTQGKVFLKALEWRIKG